ncbi:tellurite resistance protein TehB [Nonlabens dokdonensis]|uniref:Tellurite resistance protein TehB n=2 Tax=Nonlabens dokdonensis TaxID=328515 RepID=A0ABX5PXC2_9FLAO|nr:methyltransferase domain-containing protein [Nonlabens dokdonensis]AGC77613.1 putative methyltransferase [Nonlabens dokdonensis DSW-6]PZX39838.1 tellurite resistance protein TehB [Nonlabens dokdonensis]
MDKHSDIYGKALLDFQNGNYTEDLQVLSPTMEDDVLPLPYLFRSHDKMPAIERKALSFCIGDILDVGAGAGSHSVYLESKDFNITALDQSDGAIKVLHQRLQKPNSTIIKENIWQHNGRYDTILLLMNGTGIFEKLERVPLCLEMLKNMLHKNGQILIDSSDLKFLYEDPEDGGLWVDSSKEYYGEVGFSLQYKGAESELFDWLYMDFELLKSYAVAAGFQIECVYRGDHHDYLARLTF